MTEDKPPFVLPTMADVAAVRATNGLRVVSTFSGCGGSCLGFELAGFEIIYASEFVPEARETYRANHPGVPVDERDVRDVKAGEILDLIGLGVGELDVMEGSPPCASFSTAGRRSKKWGTSSKYSSTEQRSDDLFFEFARLIDGIQPRVFVAENVSGLVKGVAKGYFKEIIARLRRCGYRVAAQVLDAQWLGVPQSRQRVIFVGVRNDLGREPAFPKPLPYRYSLRDALGMDGTIHAVGLGSYADRGGQVPSREFADAPAPTITTTGPAGTADYEVRVIHDTSGHPNYSRGDVTDRPCPPVTVGVNSTDANHYKVVAQRGPGKPTRVIDGEHEPAPTIAAHGVGNVGTHQAAVSDDGVVIDPETGEDITLARYAIGAEWHRLRQGESSDRYFNLVRSTEERPAPTVTQKGGVEGAASVTHPTVARKFTIAELRRICGFPADFVLTGTYKQRWERLGRAVPPAMMCAVARTVRDEILTCAESSEP